MGINQTAEIHEQLRALIEACKGALASKDDARVPRLILDASERFHSSIKDMYKNIKYDPDERNTNKNTVSDKSLKLRRLNNHHKKRDTWLANAPIYQAMVDEYDQVGGYMSVVIRKYDIPVNAGQACFICEEVTTEKLDAAVNDRVNGEGLVEISLNRKIPYIALCNHLFVDSFDQVLNRIG